MPVVFPVYSYEKTVPSSSIFFKSDTATANDAGQWLFSNQNRQTGFFHQQTIDVMQECAATGQHHAFFGNVGTQFRRNLFKCIFDSGHDIVQRIGQGFQNFIAGNGESARDTFGEVASLDFHFLDFGCPGKRNRYFS